MSTARLELLIGNKNYSSWSMRLWVFMRAAGIDFVEQRIALFNDNWSRRIASLSPSGLVPVLRAGELTIHDSLAICEYVNELYPQAAGWPRETNARAVARSVSAVSGCLVTSVSPTPCMRRLSCAFAATACSSAVSSKPTLTP